MTKSIFKNYWEQVESKRVLRGSPTKSVAIQLSKKPFEQFDGIDVVQHLSKALECEGWGNKLAGKNWYWEIDPTHTTKTAEVKLEREIVGAGAGIWARQMSTSSGIQGARLNKRRAIDLVRANGNDSYTFIELKVKSDNPLYAIFELLGYALAYMHARNNRWEGHVQHNVMLATKIDLVILAPVGWYKYKIRGAKSERISFNLDWLIKELNKGLDALTKDKVNMQISLKHFDFYKDAPAETAKSIISLKW